MDLARLRESLETANNDESLFQSIVNAPFEQRVAAAFLFLGIVVFLQVNKTDGTIDRIALSDTELAKNTTDVSVVPFARIRVPLAQPENIIAQAIRTGKPQDTTDWKYLFEPALTPEQARINQASAGIAYSAVYPLKSRDGGALIFSYFQYEHGVTKDHHAFMMAYTKLVDERLQVQA